MSRWRPGARQRLERAALELFSERGFAATTVPEITARAGLTTRTFFRHFADKREVIFGSDDVSELATRLMESVPLSVGPGTLIVDGLRDVTQARFDGRKDELRQRLAIVESDEGLRERDLRKRAALRDAMRQGFAGRGLGAMEAALYAEVSVTLLHVALDEWIDDDGDRTLFDVVLDALRSLRDVVAGFPTAPSPPQQAEPTPGWLPDLPAD